MTKILVIDDDEFVRDLVGQILERNSYDFALAANALEARICLEEQNITLILCDIKMPGESGLDFIQYVSAEYPETAVIMVTAVDDPAVAEMAIKTGAYGYIIKPIEPSEVLINVSNALIRHRLEIENRGYREYLEQLVAERTEALRESEKKYRTILDSIDEGYFEIDLAGNFTFFNASLKKVMGYSGNELMGSNYRKYTNPDTAEQIYQTFNKVYRTGNPAKAVECEIYTKDGTKRFFLISSSLLKDSKGQPIGFRGIVRDVTDQKVLEMQLAQAQRLESIGQLAAGIAHEINTPTQYVGDNAHFLQDAFNELIQIMAKYSELLKAAKLGTVKEDLVCEVEKKVEEADVEYLIEEIPKAIQQTLEGVERISKIVLAMKEFSHSSTVEKTAIDINKAIESTIIVARNEWKYVAELVTDFDASLPLVSCLPGEFNQVILNMIINAAHAIADVVGDDFNGKGTIKISTCSNGESAEIRISDTGTGIPEEVRDRIFDPFFTTKEVGKGTGQGLAISYSVIVDRHGGTITFETELGKGTTFIIRLPMGTDKTWDGVKDE